VTPLHLHPEDGQDLVSCSQTVKKEKNSNLILEKSGKEDTEFRNRKRPLMKKWMETKSGV
jgi:hypothetical protein